MSQPGPDEHHGRVAVWKAADDARPPSGLLRDPLQPVACTYLEQMLDEGCPANFKSCIQMCTIFGCY